MTQSLSQKFDELRATVEDLDPMHAMPIGAVMIEPNPQNAREVAQAYNELQQQADDGDQQDIHETIESLHLLKDRLDADNATGGLSAESAFFAALATESLLSRLGITDEQHTASFESAITNPTGKQIVSTDTLAATLESVDSSTKTFIKRAAASLHRTFMPTWTLTKLAGAGLDGLVEKASKIKAKPGAKIKVRTKDILVGDSPSKNVAADIQKAAVILQYMLKQFGDDAAADYKFNVEATEKMSESADEADKVKGAMERLYEQWKDPRRKLGGDPAAPLIGNHVLFADNQLKYKGENPIAKKFDILANHAYPTLVGFTRAQSTSDSDSRKVEIAALTPQEIAKIAVTLKDAHKAFGFWSSTWEGTKATTTTVALAGGLLSPLLAVYFFPGFLAWAALLNIKLVRRSDDMDEKAGEAWFAEDVRTVYDAMVTSSRLRFHVGFDASRVLRIVTRLFKKLAKESLKAHATASTEAMDQATATVGESVNETAPNEPVQLPPKEDQAPPTEVVPHQPSFQDNPESHQNLNGNVQSTESLSPVPYWFRK